LAINNEGVLNLTPCPLLLTRQGEGEREDFFVKRGSAPLKHPV